MQLELKGLIIDKTQDSIDVLESALEPDIVFDCLETVNTVHKAIQQQMITDFDVCLIAESFPDNELKAFFDDFVKLGKQEPCVFIQFRNSVEVDFDRESLQEIGFATVISTKGDHKDKDHLWKALKPFIHRRKYGEVVKELDNVVDKLLNEVDKIAKEHKRGRKKKLSNVVSRYLQDTSVEFEKLKEDYVEKLLKSSESAKPFIPVKVEIPETILVKQLPHLHKEGYKGQSHRVSAKLQGLHGEEEQQNEKTTEEDLDTVTEPPTENNEES